jgi:hypothetical protein
MKDYMKAFWAGIPLGIVFGFFAWLGRDLISGMIGGVIVAVIVGVASMAFLYFQKRKFRKNGPSNTGGQRIVIDGPCNHFVGKESVGGWMYLTEREVIFVSHKVNVHVHSLTIPLNTISEVNFYRSLGIVPNGLSITTCAGGVERFVVYNRKDWARAIEKSVNEQR